MNFDEKELRSAILGLAGSMAAAGDQAQMMTDAELGECLLTGRWTTIEIHEASRRLKKRPPHAEKAERALAEMREALRRLSTQDFPFANRAYLMREFARTALRPSEDTSDE